MNTTLNVDYGTYQQLEDLASSLKKLSFQKANENKLNFLKTAYETGLLTKEQFGESMNNLWKEIRGAE